MGPCCQLRDCDSGPFAAIAGVAAFEIVGHVAALLTMVGAGLWVVSRSLHRLHHLHHLHHLTNDRDPPVNPTAPFDTLIFDLDGTLSDSAPGIVASLNHAYDRLGHPKPASFQHFIGPPFETIFRSEGFSPDEIITLLAVYRERYWDIGAFENSIYPGIEDVLDQLAAQGYRIAIATSKPEATALRILEHFGYIDRFEVIGGATFDMRRATKSAVLSYVLDQLGETRPVMIGDRYHDVEGAAEHGIDCIGVRWGYGVGDELQRCGARWIIDEPAQIMDIVHGEVLL